MKKKRHTIGTDPEFFLIERDTGKLKSAIPYIRGSKHKPEPLPHGGTIQRDNVAVEFATPYAIDGEDFVLKVGNAFKDLMKEIPEGHDLVASPSANFDPDQLDHEEAQAFGCDPDYDVWTMDENIKPYAPDSTFRSCGAHIHVGHVKGDGNDFLLEFEGKFNTIKMMDLIHGIISTILDKSPEAIARKELYGKAGCHRITSYGVEYRVLSNFWMKSPQLVMLMDSLTGDVLTIIRNNKHEKMIEEVGAETIVSTINKGDVDKAKEIIETHLMPILSETSKDLLEMCIENMDHYDFKQEWKMEVSE